MTKSIYTKAWPGTIPDSDRLGSGGADDDGLWGGRVAAAGPAGQRDEPGRHDRHAAPAGGRAGGAQRGGRGQEAGQAVAGETCAALRVPRRAAAPPYRAGRGGLAGGRAGRAGRAAAGGRRAVPAGGAGLGGAGSADGLPGRAGAAGGGGGGQPGHLPGDR